MFECSLAAYADGGRISLIAVFITLSHSSLLSLPLLSLFLCHSFLLFLFSPVHRAISLMGEKPLPKW